MSDFQEQIQRSIQDFREYNIRAESAIEKALLKCGQRVERTAKELFKGRDDSSVKGEPPRVDTGRYRASITHSLEKEGNETVVYVGSNVEYAYDLEFGTSRTWPHPLLGPAGEMNDAQNDEEIAEALRGADNA